MAPLHNSQLRRGDEGEIVSRFAGALEAIRAVAEGAWSHDEAGVLGPVALPRNQLELRALYQPEVEVEALLAVRLLNPDAAGVAHVGQPAEGKLCCREKLGKANVGQLVPRLNLDPGSPGTDEPVGVAEGTHEELQRNTQPRLDVACVEVYASLDSVDGSERFVIHTAAQRIAEGLVGAVDEPYLVPGSRALLRLFLRMELVHQPPVCLLDPGLVSTPLNFQHVIVVYSLGRGPYPCRQAARA
mmetsp:Transcript_12558/g.27799  ORF Transcript_12558/g.27799 Transcript_12558/m.27799 type:complete len:243 (+) Transcript_12558:420-1148(+)